VISSFALKTVQLRAPRFVACALTLALGCVFSCRAAEDPSRFLSVTNWYATLSHTLNESGNFDYTDLSGCAVSASWQYHHTVTVSFQLKPDPLFVGNPYVRNFIWLKDNSSSVVVKDQFDQTTTCSQSVVAHHSWTVNGTGKAPTTANVSMVVNTLGPSYAINVVDLNIPVASLTTYDSSSTPGQNSLSWSPEHDLTNSLPTTGMKLQGTKSYPMTKWYYLITPAASDFSPGDANFGGTSPLAPTLFSQDLTLDWNLTPSIEQLEVVIESSGYRNWLPKGDLQNQDKTGDVLYFTAVLQTTNGTAPAVSRATNFKFELLNVSTEPGVCLNNPSQQSASTQPDLKFESYLNVQPFVENPLLVQDSGATAVTIDGDYLQAEAGVSSFDFGAYGELKVTALVNGQEIVGYWQLDPQKKAQPLLLPRRQPDSKIADQWKEDNGVTDLADDDDSENDPVGDGHTGDGLSLYEEYRGFSENLQHVRTDPKRKDLLICDTIRSGISSAGIGLFAAQSGLVVHSRMRQTEMHYSSGLNGDTWINFNHSQNVPHIVDQHGVLILMNPVSEGKSYSAGPYGSTPAGTGPILIDPAAVRDDGWISVNLAGGGKVLGFNGAATTAHELAHTCAVWHHGDTDQTVSWTPVITLINGKWTTIAKENGQPITEKFESGSLQDPVITGAGIWIGVPQGQHSGDEDCMMRYDNAEAYRSQKDPNVRYVVQEVPGFTLCTSAAGTGVNVLGRAPQPRYGDAASGRGNCKAQICVNDLHNGDPTHDR
jgi:hypothetical protein